MNAVSPAIQIVCRDQVFEALMETAGFAESYAASLREACWRGDQHEAHFQLAQLRSVVITTIQIFREFKKIEDREEVA